MEFTTEDFYHFILLRITEEAGQKEWEDKVRGVLRAAKNDGTVSDHDFENFCKRFFETGAEVFGAIKTALRGKVEETKDRHKELLEKSENGNPFGQDHFLGENMIRAKGLEDLRAGWAETQTAPVETIEGPLPELLRYTQTNNSDLRVKLVSAASRSYTIRDFEGLEELFIKAWGAIFPKSEPKPPEITFGLSENQLGALYDGLVNMGSLDGQTSKTNFVNIHLGRASTGKITFLRGGKTSSEMPLIVEMYFQIGVFVTLNKGIARIANISEDFQPFLQEHYTNSLSSLRNQAGQFKSGATQKAKEIIRLISTIKSITN